MYLEPTIIERVETFVRHPVFQGSDEVMEDVLDDLEFRASVNQISQATYLRLGELILQSPHFVRNN